MEADFEGWATKTNIVCSDGRTITPDAFKHMDGKQVPLLYNHGHKDATNILGHAVFSASPEGLRVKGYFNETEQGKNAKLLVHHKDLNALSIFANRLVERDKNVLHGNLVEVSLVLAGANKGALIDNVRVTHSDDPDLDFDLEEEAVIHTGLPLEFEEIEHSEETAESEEDEEEIEHAELTAKDVVDSMTEEQKTVLYALVQAAADGQGTAEHTDQEGSTMTHNVFDQTGAGLEPAKVLSHDQIKTIFKDASKLGSLKESLLMHAEEIGLNMLQHAEGDYGIGNLELLFPDAKAIDNIPEFIARRMEWVSMVLSGTKKVPFSKIKSLSADITHDEARAKGYIKGNLKKEEYFAIAKRETSSTTIYKKQKLDRDDIIDVTTMDMVAWLWGEMRLMLDEEIARAILIGDGREVDDEDKINESKIRPIAYDDDFYSDKVVLPSNVVGDALVEAIIRARPKLRGNTGLPTMFTTESVLIDMLLIKDNYGRRLYASQSELESTLRVSKIVAVEVMEDKVTDAGDLLAILVNLADYAIGTDKGGEISRFDDFDIDYNQYKYLLEGRMSGALFRHKSAQVISRVNGTLVDTTFSGADAPTFVNATGVATLPNITGVVWKMNGVTKTPGAQTAIAAGSTVTVTATPATGYKFKHNIDTDWDFKRDA